MNQLILILMLFTVSLLAREEMFPTQECPAFNNLKHTQNTHGVHLDKEKKYTILRHYKGQNLIVVKGEQPSQRWVDESCFHKHSDAFNPLNVRRAGSKVLDIDDGFDQTQKYDNSKISKQNILTLSWHNAFCEMHRVKKECQRSLFAFGRFKYREKHFVLHGLWPQPKDNIYCGVERHTVMLDKHKQWNRLPDIALNDEIKGGLQKVMPGVASSLHKHEWIKHGTCYGTDANRYYKDAIQMVEQVNASRVGDFFKKQIGKRVTLQQVRAVFDRSFGLGAGKRVELKCNKGLITELWLHIGAGSDDLGVLLTQGKQTRSHCQGGFVDKAGF